MSKRIYDQLSVFNRRLTTGEHGPMIYRILLPFFVAIGIVIQPFLAIFGPVGPSIGGLAYAQSPSCDFTTTPPSSPSPIMWLNAETLDDTLNPDASIASWPDDSGNGNSVSQTTGSLQATFVYDVNGKPAASFDSDRYDLPISLVDQDYTVIVVFDGTGFAYSESASQRRNGFISVHYGSYPNEYIRWEDTDDKPNQLYTTTAFQRDPPRIIEMSRNGDDAIGSLIESEVIDQQTFDITGFDASPFDVGYVGTYERTLPPNEFLDFSGYIYEIVVFDSYQADLDDWALYLSRWQCEETTSLPPLQAASPTECPICSSTELNNFTDYPINTYSGNFNYETTDISIPTLGKPLSFERAYNGLTTLTSTLVYSKPLGYGWTHSYDVNLTFPTTDTIAFKARHGSQMEFLDTDGDGTFTPRPGVWATITQTGVLTTAVYTITAGNQETFVFTDTGKIINHIDPQGNETSFSYTDGITLTRVTGPSGQRYLDFDYDNQGRVITVTDHTSRTIEYGYDSDDNLTVMTDTRGLTWTYIYTSPSPHTIDPHLLHEIIDPDGRIVEKTFFDSEGRAIRQEDGLGNTIVEITYVSTYTRIITEAGKVYTDSYDIRGLLVGQENSLGEEETFDFDGSFNRDNVIDANGNETKYVRDEFGLTSVITDALGNETSFTYDDNNNLTSSTDARGNTTLYLYDGQNNLISTTNALTGTTVYTYNDEGQVTSVTDENTNKTEYAYDSFGNRTVITDALTHITTFEYDALGRVVTTTDALDKITVNEYDAGDNLIKVTENYTASQSQNYQDEYNIVTEYAYDGANRRTLITDTLGRVTENVYDDAGRLEQSIQNKHPSNTTPYYLDQYNLITTYGYDQFGRQNAITDTLGHVTLTQFDDAGRVHRTIVNHVDGAYTSTKPDEDIITEFVYEDNGNLQQTIEFPDTPALKRISYTEYDELNRVEKTIENYVNGPMQPQ